MQVSTWHWGSDSNSYGINFVVNDDAKAAATLGSYLENGVTRVYGGYSQIPVHPTQKLRLAAWNKRLQASGIKSIYLIGSALWIYPENRQQMLDLITQNYIGFNKLVATDERMLGLHLDIEPHQLSEWSSASLSRKRELLEMLKDTYKEVRTLLTTNGLASDEVTVDIPVWFDETSAVGWASTSDRNAWFAEASTYINGFTLMAYEVASVDAIVQRTAWERGALVVEIALNADEIGSVWSTKKSFVDALTQLSSVAGGKVALHDYAVFMQK